MWQQVAVYIIGIIVVAYIAVALYRLVTRRGDPCSGCAGCDLKNELDRKRRTCSESRQNEQENGCNN